MCQGFLFPAAHVIGATCMAGLTPSGTVAHAVVVIHPHASPATRAGVAGVAIHACTIEKLDFRNVVAGLGQRTL